MKYMNELCLSTEQINGMLDTAEEVLTLANRYGNVGTEIPKCIIASANSYKRIHVGYLCAAAKGFFVIDPARTNKNLQSFSSHRRKCFRRTLD